MAAARSARAAVFTLALTLAVAPHAAAQNLLANPGFETGDFTGWTVSGSATSGVDVDGTPITGTILASNEVNVRSGTYAAWGKLAQVSGVDLVLEQTVIVAPDTPYEVSFWAGLSALSDAGRYAEIVVDGTTIYDGFYVGAVGGDPEDFVRPRGTWTSGPGGGSVTVTFTLKGSGTGLSGFSWDDFSFEPLQTINLFANAGFETCDFSGWVVGGNAVSGVDVDDTPIAGTVIPSNVVNVRDGCAAWAKVANFSGIELTLAQSVYVEPHTTYEVSFWNGLGGDLNAARLAEIKVAGLAIFDHDFLGANGTEREDYVQPKAYYTSGASAATVNVVFTLRGSGSGLSGLSWDDFSFAPVATTNLLTNPDFGTCDFSGWVVSGVAESGVATDGTPIAGSAGAFQPNAVNVRSVPCALWANVSNTSGIDCVIAQTVNVQPNTDYEVGFWNAFDAATNAARFATIDINGIPIFDGSFSGVLGPDSSDFVRVKAGYTSDATGGPIRVRFTLKGSGTSLAGMSWDDFFFQPAPVNLLANPGFETCDFTGWTVGGLAASGVDADDTPITGTVIPSNVVNVHGGTCAAWAKVARVSGIHFELEQTVNVEPGTTYDVSFWDGLGGTSNAGRRAEITVGGQTVFSDFYTGQIGTDPSDCVQVKAQYHSGATSGPVVVHFSLRGSGTALAGISYDDFEFVKVGPTSILATDPSPAPRTVRLGLPRPNPFAHETTIPFEIARAGPVRLEVFDVRGARVRTVVNRRFEPGLHTARWDGVDERGRAAAAGVYFVRLVTDAGQDRGRIVLSR